MRSISYDRDGGFKLNGKKTIFKGVCMHHDLGPIGAAFNVSAARRQVEILKEMGANAIRTSHNPPSPALLDICDELGMLVQVEAFDEWKMPKCENGYNKLFDKWAKKDLEAMIRRDRNHPCVVMWSIGNEVPEQTVPEGRKTAKFLAETARAMDPTRPVTAGCDRNKQAVEYGFVDELDLVGFNYKPFYYKECYDKKPSAVIYGSETASTVSSRGVYHFRRKRANSRGRTTTRSAPTTCAARRGRKCPRTNGRGRTKTRLYSASSSGRASTISGSLSRTTAILSQRARILG